MTDIIKIRGKIVQSFYHNPNGFCVLKIQVGSKTIIVAGSIIEPENIVGLNASFEGQWDTHSKYGKQFRFSSYAMEDSGVFFFLARVVKGLSESLAREVIDTYGENEIIRIIEECPERLEEIKGIKGKKRKKIVESWAKHKAVYVLSQYLGPFGIPASTIMRIYNHFGDQSLKVIEKNPYSLTAIRGFGFKSADRVAEKLGVDPQSVNRIRECLVYVLLQSSENGSTVMLPGDLVSLTKKELDDEKSGIIVGEEKIYECLEYLITAERAVEIDGSIALARYYQIEKRILEIIHTRIAQPQPFVMNDMDTEKFIRSKELSMGMNFSSEQKDFIRMIGQGKRTAILCGYAGTGKSTISKVALDMLADVYGKETVTCMALSGVASRRIRKLTGYNSNTIHTTLSWNGQRFEFNRDNRLPFKVVMLDETSMVNSELFCSVLEALQDDAIFLMLGDDAQLPPIGAGDVFHDIIQSGFVPMVKMTRIFRQDADSVLIEFANTIRQGEVPKDYQGRAYKDFQFIDHSVPKYWILKKTLPEKEFDVIKGRNNQEIVDLIVAQAKLAMPRIQDPISDFQVLAPMKNHTLGTENLNNILQKILNPGNDENAVEKFGVRFKVCDKVVHLRNKEMPVMDWSCYREQGCFDEDLSHTRRIFNGNVGIIESIDNEDEFAYVRYLMDDNDIIVRYDFSHLADILNLAYCISVHKAQGNEYREVVIPVASQHFIMMNSKWLYTAITRTRQKATIIGHSYIFERGCKTRKETKRKTVLSLLSPPLEEIAEDRESLSAVSGD